jgi:hypothetical protein
MICSVCGKDRRCNTIRLTEAEKKANEIGELKPPDEYHFCRPCERIMADREGGARLIQGMYSATARMFGAKNYEQMSNELYKYLIDQSKKGRVS